MSEQRVERLPKEAYQTYLSKADEALRSMRADLAAERFNSVGVQAIQTVISASDAVTVFHLGVRSTGRDHREVLDLLRRVAAEDLDLFRRHVSIVLDVKNMVQYEPGALEPKVARRIALQAERVLEWAIQHTGSGP